MVGIILLYVSYNFLLWVKKWLKLVCIYQSYRKIKTGIYIFINNWQRHEQCLFWNTVYTLLQQCLGLGQFMLRLQMMPKQCRWSSYLGESPKDTAVETAVWSAGCHGGTLLLVRFIWHVTTRQTYKPPTQILLMDDSDELQLIMYRTIGLYQTLNLTPAIDRFIKVQAMEAVAPLTLDLDKDIIFQAKATFMGQKTAAKMKNMHLCIY